MGAYGAPLPYRVFGRERGVGEGTGPGKAFSNMHSSELLAQK